MTEQLTGRPTKYDLSYDQLAHNYCLLGATNEQLAYFFEVTTSTIANWLNEHPSFLDAVKKGRADADANVAKALYHRAIGYSHKAVKIMQSGKESFEHEYVEHYPPDTAAAFIWLKNRQPKMWRDKMEHTVRRISSLEDLDDEEIERLHESAQRKLGSGGAVIETTAEVVETKQDVESK